MSVKSLKLKVRNQSFKLINFAFLIVIFNFSFLALSGAEGLIFHLDKAAAAGLSMGISPPILQITAQPPASINAPITIENLGEEPITLAIKFKPFTASSKTNGEVEYLPQDQTVGPDPLIFQRMQVRDDLRNIKNLTLAPSQAKKLTLHIGIPKDEELGDYYFSVVFLPSTFPEANSNVSQNVAGIATNVLLSIGPKGETTGYIEEFSAPFFLEKGPVPFTVKVKNTSDHFVSIKGEIIIKNVFGKIVDKVDLLPVNVLSKTSRFIPDSLESSNQAFFKESVLFGPYTATLKLALSDEGPIFTRTIRFVGLPIQIIIAFFLVIFIILIIRERLKKQLNR